MKNQTIPAERRAMVLDRLSLLRAATIPMPACNNDEVLIKIKSVGICGSDMNYYLKGGSTFAPVTYPHLLGHESAGDVVYVGKNVKNVSVGDRVAIEPGYPCGKCSYCSSGKYNLCEEISFMSTPIYRPYSEGAFAEYTVRPTFGLHKLPDTMSYEEGAMLEPLAVAMQAVETADARTGMSALILGCGPISMCVLLSLRAAGLTNIYMIDIVEERTKMAVELGATAASLQLDEVFTKRIMDETRQLGVDVVFDTTDYAPLVNKSLYVTKKGGKVVLIAVPHQDMIQLDMRQLFMSQISVHTTFRYANQYPKAIDLVASNIIPISKIITHRFDFMDADKAFQVSARKDGNVCKIVLNWQSE